MPRRSDSPIWVQGLRAQLRSTVGPAYRLVEQRCKAKLDVRYADGSRGTAVLPVQWVPAQARQIQEAVERVAQQLSMGRTLRQSLELIEGTSSPAPAPAAKPATREPCEGLSAANLAIQPLGQQVDPDEHRQIGDPHVREVKVCVVDQHQTAIADCAINQGPAQWSDDFVQVEWARCCASG